MYFDLSKKLLLPLFPSRRKRVNGRKPAGNEVETIENNEKEKKS